jgi:hypothetical protein
VDKEQQWRLAYVLPNLQLESPIEFDGLAFVPNSDPRLGPIRASNKASRALLDGFKDSGGTQLHPAAAIHISPTTITNLMEAMVDARNCFALACVLNGWKISIGELNNFLIRDSDYFDFYPRWPSDDGKNLCYLGPALEWVSPVPTNFAAQAHPYILPSNPRFSRPEPDEELFPNLCKIWRRIHVTRKAQSADYRRLRSLSIAYEACRVPQGMDNPLYDHGKHCSFWVSALETLAHPTRKRVTLREVLLLLEKRPMRNPRINRRRLTVTKWAKKKGKRERMALNLVQRLYKRLYYARNAFLHGNKLSIKIFIPSGLRKGIRLLDVAPLIYLTALEAEIGQRQSRALRSRNLTTRMRALIESGFRRNVLEDAFCRAMGFDTAVSHY